MGKKMNKAEANVVYKKLIVYRDAGLTQKLAAELLGMKRTNVAAFCFYNGISGWPQGAAARDQTGENKPNFKTGASRATIRRTTERVIIDSGRSLFVCERCSSQSNVALARHHKDRDRLNNSPDNIEVLCCSCHTLEHQHERIRSETTGRFIG